MDCPKCGTWNPDDKRVCWRCQAEMPKPAEKKARKRPVFLGMPIWVWAMFALLFILSVAGQCLGPALLGGQ